MSDRCWQYLGFGIYCVDANYIRPGLACCYLVVEEDSVAIVETGTANTVPAIMALLEEIGLAAGSVRYIIPTHVHLDHAGGAGALMALCPGAQLIVHPRGARHMVNPEKLIAGTVAVYGQEKFDRLYGQLVPVPESRVVAAEDGRAINLSGRELLIRHTPGHAEHHFCIWDERSRGWFSGDTFGLCYRELRYKDGSFILPTTTPVQFDPEKMKASIKLMLSYQPERMYLTHYSVIEQPEQLAGQMLGLVDEFCELAENADQDRLQQDIDEKLTQLVERKVRLMAPEADPGKVRAWLAMDIQLNAQGLVCWLENKRGK